MRLYGMKGLVTAILAVTTALAAAQEPAPVRDGTAVGTPAAQANRNLLELLNRVEQLERELRQLRGEVELLNNETRTVKQRQRELYLDVDRRLRATEGRGGAPTAPVSGADTGLGGGALGGAAPAPDGAGAPGPGATVDGAPVDDAGAPTTTVTTPPPPAGNAAPQSPSRAERDAYHRARNLLKEGRYNQSVTAFRQFVSDYPRSSYADNAQYWLGEANYVSRNYQAALKEFQKVEAQYPQSAKVPDAMLKKGFTHYELRQYKEARTVLEQVVQRYPDSQAAKRARTRLDRMTSEGR